MLTRITHWRAGFMQYLEKGGKEGSQYTRDEKDRRIYLAGDAEAFNKATEHTLKHKKWDTHYSHITVSFREDEAPTHEQMKAVCREYLQYLFAGYDIDNLAYYAEIHQPKVQTEVDKSTGEEIPRLIHFHIGVSKLDMETGNQLRMTQFRRDADQSFQSYVCKKHGLADPQDYKRREKITKARLLSRWKGDQPEKHTKQGRNSQLRRLFQMVTKCCTTDEQVRQAIMDTGLVNKIHIKTHKSGSKRLELEMMDGRENIHIRGKGFEHLAGIYGQTQRKKMDNEERDYESWRAWKEAQADDVRKKRKNQQKRNPNKYRSFAEKYSKEQRNYYVVYKSSIKKETIRGYRIWEKNNERFLVNRDSNTRIYDRPDKIVADIPKGAEPEAIKLMLELAMQKGWDIRTMEITGSREFRAEAERQRELLIMEQDMNEMMNGIRQMPSIAPQPRRLAPCELSRKTDELNEEKLKRERRDQLNRIKTQLRAEAVLRYAETNFGLNRAHYERAENNSKINDKRNKQKPKNVIDFMTKTCGQDMKTAVSILQQLLDEQMRGRSRAYKNTMK